MQVAFGVVVALLALSTWRARAWRPVVVALAAPWALDLWAAGARLAPRDDLALWLASPVAGAWCAWRILGGVEVLTVDLWSLAAWSGGMVFVQHAGGARWWWSSAPLGARLLSMAAQGMAARAWWRGGRIGGRVELAAVALLAGDLVSLLGPAGLLDRPWWAAEAQALAIAALVLLLAVTRGRGTRSAA